MAWRATCSGWMSRVCARSMPRCRKISSIPRRSGRWHEWFSRWKTPKGALVRLVNSCPEYTLERAQRKAASCLHHAHFFLCGWHVLDKCIARRDIIAYQKAESDMVGCLVSALFAVNREPGRQWKTGGGCGSGQGSSRSCRRALAGSARKHRSAKWEPPRSAGQPPGVAEAVRGRGGCHAGALSRLVAADRLDASASQAGRV